MIPREEANDESMDAVRDEHEFDALDEEFEREFGARVMTKAETGPEPWDGFLDLSTL
jgi:hypothetical protein